MNDWNHYKTNPVIKKQNQFGNQSSHLTNKQEIHIFQGDQCGTLRQNSSHPFRHTRMCICCNSGHVNCSPSLTSTQRAAALCFRLHWCVNGHILQTWRRRPSTQIRHLPKRSDVNAQIPGASAVAEPHIVIRHRKNVWRATRHAICQTLCDILHIVACGVVRHRMLGLRCVIVITVSEKITTKYQFSPHRKWKAFQRSRTPKCLFLQHSSPAVLSPRNVT